MCGLIDKVGFIIIIVFFQIKVMHKQLLLLHNAIAAYFSGNAVALEATLKQFNIKVSGQLRLIQFKPVVL